MKYQDILQLSPEAYNFLTTANLAEYADGQYDLGNGAYVKFSTYTTKLRKDAFYEAHLDYVDIQFVVEGEEIIAVESLDAMHSYPCTAPYDKEKDVELYGVNSDGIDHVLRAGDYLILYPEHAHMGSICIGKQSTARKALFKIPVKK